MSQERRLLPVVPTELTAPEQALRCVPYRATILAAACLRRQRVATAQASQGSWRPDDGKLRGDYAKCLTCGIGPTVRARLEGEGA